MYYWVNKFIIRHLFVHRHFPSNVCTQKNNKLFGINSYFPYICKREIEVNYYYLNKN